MTKTILIVTLLGILVLTGLSVNDAFAAGYIKFDGVDGEDTMNRIDAVHTGWSDVLSISHTVVKKPRSTELGFDISKAFDKSSPKLEEMALKGTVNPLVKFEFVKEFDRVGGPVDTYYTYELKNVRVTKYSINVSQDCHLDFCLNRLGDFAVPNTDLIKEQFSLSFEEIKVTYIAHDQRGVRTGIVEYSFKVQ